MRALSRGWSFYGKKFSKKQPTIWTFGRLIFRKQSTLKMQFYLIVVSFFVKTLSRHPLLLSRLSSWAATSRFERVCSSGVTHVLLMLCHTEDTMVHISLFVSLISPLPLSSSPLICHLAWHAFCLQTNKKIDIKHNNNTM